ncbi:MAG: peptide/nickel transport system substrate-binding protein, partial [Gaiellaceae bacterium]|nr:peptide/nickel transport system substrate-binding protein [Gaiellaceae bacterium]
MAVALVAAGCGSDQAAPASSAPRAVGPPNVVRIALSDFRWPLDPALAAGRDELTLARTLYATPLRTDPSTGGVVPGLCTAWRASPDFRRWTFTCRSASSIAAALRRVKRLDGAPARQFFADAVVTAPSATTLVVDLPYPWRRFPYALTVVGAAPRFVPGPFKLVSGTTHLVVAKGEG